MPNDDWGTGLPSGPMPTAQSDESTAENKGDGSNTQEAPTWTAPSFAPRPAEPEGVIPQAAPREVTLEKKEPRVAGERPPHASTQVATPTVPKTPYPRITESFNDVTATKPPIRRSPTLIYGTPPLKADATPVGPPPSGQSPRPSLADEEDALSHSFVDDDDNDTIINPVAPSVPHAAPQSVAPEHRTEDASAIQPPAAQAPRVNVSSPPAATAADPRSFSDDGPLSEAETILATQHPETEIDSGQAGIHSAPTEAAQTAERTSTAQSQLPTASATGVVESEVGPPPEFDDDTEQNPPSVSAAFFGQDGSNAIANNRQDTTEAPGPTASAAFFASPGTPSPSDSPVSAGAAPRTTAPVSDAKTLAPVVHEATERIERTAPGGAPLSGIGDEDDDLALVQRSKRNTMIAAVAVLLLLLGSIAGAFALGVFDEKAEKVAKGPGRDITKDPRRELYTSEKPSPTNEANGENAATGKAAGDGKASQSAPANGKDQAAAATKRAADKVAADKAAEDQAAKDKAAADKAADEAAKREAAAEKAKKDAEDRKVAAARDRENGALHDDAGDEVKPEKDTRRRRRSRTRPKTEETDRAAAAAPTPAVAKTKTFKVQAPSSIRWRTTSGKELGRGNASLKVPPTTTTVIAYDPRRGVKTKVALKDGKTVSYGDLPRGTLEIRVFPFADVYIGSEKVGTTPFAPLKVVPGTYKLKFVNEGKTRKSTVTIRAGKIKRVKVNFNAPQ